MQVHWQPCCLHHWWYCDWWYCCSMHVGALAALLPAPLVVLLQAPVLLCAAYLALLLLAGFLFSCCSRWLGATTLLQAQPAW